MFEGQRGVHGEEDGAGGFDKMPVLDAADKGYWKREGDEVAGDGTEGEDMAGGGGGGAED